MSGMFSDEEIDPKKGKTVPLSKSPKVGINKNHLGMIAKKSPQVMVKLNRGQSKDGNGKTIITAPRDKASLRGLVAYMGKDGNEVTDEQGFAYVGDDLMNATNGWRGMKETGGKKREVFHIIMSMPKGTPDREVGTAVRRFAKAEFEGHQFLIASHYDTPQPHAHIALKVESIDGVNRLNPNRDDLQRWRERFAEELRDLGIDAAASSRVDRLSTRKSLSKGEYMWAEKKGAEFLQKHLYRKPTSKEMDRARQHLRDAYQLDKGDATDQRTAAGLRELVSEKFPSMQKADEITL